MNLKKSLPLLMMLLFASSVVFGQSNELVTNDQHYNKAIHIMAMLLVGFGFLMVFVKNYGRSALTATFLLVSISLPLYILVKSRGLLGEVENEIDRLIMAEFGAASLLIAAGAVLGRLKMHQYILLGLLFVPFYIFNEWLLLDEGFGLLAKGAVIDTGGSIVIHAFGAIFGLGVALTMTTQKEFEKPVEADATSDRFSMLGSMILWIFWPSFCAALVPAELMAQTVVNVIIALCGSTLATYFVSLAIRKKINIADIANAALAGGVAIGSTCAHANYAEAGIIGLLAGAISTIGFAVVQRRMQKGLKLIDTCGVSNLHGLPGLFGGLAALFIVGGIDATSQLAGIGITILIAIAGGLITGKLLALFGRRVEAYQDAEEFMDAEE